MPDPTVLPVAATQGPLFSAYGLLKVPAIPSGGFYLDPTTGVKVWKLTSNAYPAAGSWNHDYAEGGDEVSLPHTGLTRSVLVRKDGATYWLVDFTPGQPSPVGNARVVPSSLAPYMDVAFAFSSNPATPYYAYSCVGWPTTVIKRWDIRSMLEVPGGGWPKTGEDGARWLHQSENDGLFVWMLGNGGPVVGYEPSTGTRRQWTVANVNEPRIDRAGKYICAALNNNGLQVIDFAGGVVWTLPGDPGIPFQHVAALRRRFYGVDWNISFPDQFYKLDPSVPGSAVRLPGAAPGTEIHVNGNWIQHPADLDDQWAACSIYGPVGGLPAGPAWLAPGGIILLTAKGQRRLLGHSYNQTGNYAQYSFPKFSPDGAFLLFTSDMNGSGRSDVFLAELPGAIVVVPPPPPPVDATPPGISGVAVSSIGQTTAVVSWVTDEPADSQVEFGLTDIYGVLALDPSRTLSHAQTLSGLAPGSLHHYRVISRDAAGNTAKSLDATFTTLPVPPVVVPPIIITAAKLQFTVLDLTGKPVGIGTIDLK